MFGAGLRPAPSINFVLVYQRKLYWGKKISCFPYFFEISISLLISHGIIISVKFTSDLEGFSLITSGMGRIFINYRRADSEGYAGRIMIALYRILVKMQFLWMSTPSMQG
jgi:hypothetical protein